MRLRARRRGQRHPADQAEQQREPEHARHRVRMSARSRIQTVAMRSISPARQAAAGKEADITRLGWY